MEVFNCKTRQHRYEHTVAYYQRTNPLRAAHARSTEVPFYLKMICEIDYIGTDFPTNLGRKSIPTAQPVDPSAL